jgi:hypothetical protein
MRGVIEGSQLREQRAVVGLALQLGQQRSSLLVCHALHVLQTGGVRASGGRGPGRNCCGVGDLLPALTAARSESHDKTEREAERGYYPDLLRHREINGNGIRS